MSEDDECIFKPPSLPTQIILTHTHTHRIMIGLPCIHHKRGGYFQHIVHKKEDYQQKRIKKKRIYESQLETPPHFSARSSLNY
jgi:hypothetical protein